MRIRFLGKGPLTVAALALAVGLGTVTSPFDSLAQSDGGSGTVGDEIVGEERGAESTFDDEQTGQVPAGDDLGMGAHPFWRFSDIDTDDDGDISPTEARQHRSNIFAILDFDGDGQISNAEFRRHQAALLPLGSPAAAISGTARSDVQFAEIDQDRNGSVSQDEFMTNAQQAFEASLSEGTAALTLDDYQEAFAGIGYNPGRVDLNQDAAVSPAEAADDAQLGFVALDADGDGSLSLLEWHAAERDPTAVRPLPGRGFVMLDADGDGSISRVEFFEAQPSQQAAEMPGPIPVWQFWQYQ